MLATVTLRCDGKKETKTWRLKQQTLQDVKELTILVEKGIQLWDIYKVFIVWVLLISSPSIEVFLSIVVHFYYSFVHL